MLMLRAAILAALAALDLALAAVGFADAPHIAVAGAAPRGDVNCNGVTNAIDSALILQLDAGLLASLPCQLNGDVDHNAVANALDSVRILQLVALLIPALPALVRIEIETAQPIAIGEEFVAEILVEDVEHLGAFDFELSFDEDLVSMVRTEGLGAIFAASERTKAVCLDPDTYREPLWACITLGTPVCKGGPSGPSGSGTLARIVFRAQRPGLATLRLTKATLIWDDLRPCDLDRTDPIVIPHQRANAQVQIEDDLPP